MNHKTLMAVGAELYNWHGSFDLVVYIEHKYPYEKESLLHEIRYENIFAAIKPEASFNCVSKRFQD